MSNTIIKERLCELLNLCVDKELYFKYDNSVSVYVYIYSSPIERDFAFYGKAHAYEHLPLETRLAELDKLIEYVRTYKV